MKALTDRTEVSLAVLRKAVRRIGKTENDFREAHPEAFVLKPAKSSSPLHDASHQFEYVKSKTLSDWLNDNGF